MEEEKAISEEKIDELKNEIERFEILFPHQNN